MLVHKYSCWTNVLPRVLWWVGEEVYETGDEIGLGKVEERVEYVNSRLVQCQELIWIQLVYLWTETKDKNTKVLEYEVSIQHKAATTGSMC